MIRIAVAGALVALAVVPLRPAAQDAAGPGNDSVRPSPAAVRPDPTSVRPEPVERTETLAPPEAPPPASAEPDPEAERKKLEEEIAKELGTAPAEAQPPAPAGPAAPAAPGAPAAAGGSPYARLLLLPDLSAVGSFAAAYDSYDVEALSPRTGPFGPEDRVHPLFEELEVGIQAVVDPYARADLFIAFGPDEIAVEEAYLTSLALPWGLGARAGQLFSPFGRLNPLHPHAWEFPEAPLARGRLLAEEVLAGPGLEVGWLAPLPWFAELKLAGQSTAPGEEDEARLTGVARLLQYASLSETTTVGLGFSGALREDGADVSRLLGGADVYLRWRPLTSRAYLALQAELFARRFRGGATGAEGGPPGGTDTGWYAQAFWRQGARLGAGVRYEEAPAGGEAEPGTERRASALGTWFLSEFQRVRLQVAYDRLPGGRDGLEALVHLEFGIGAHGAHPF
jgi:hypothetical protein